MKKKLLLNFESPRERYKAEGTVVWCSDHRFSLALQVFSERMGWKNFDLIEVAGAARDLAGASGDPDRAKYLLDQIEKSIRMNHSPEVFLMAHYNCITYGRDQMDPSDEEDRFLASELEAGKKYVADYLTEAGLKAKIRLLLCDFKNIYEIE
jgi:hypothetical protein